MSKEKKSKHKSKKSSKEKKNKKDKKNRHKKESKKRLSDDGPARPSKKRSGETSALVSTALTADDYFLKNELFRVWCSLIKKRYCVRLL
jgi:outer membrane biosynthesis protein TonB